MYFYLLFVYKIIIFGALTFFSFLNKIKLLPEKIHDYISLFLLSEIGPVFIKISQVSQNNFIDSEKIIKKKSFFSIVDNVYSKKKIDLDYKIKDLKIINNLSIASGSIAYVFEVLFDNKRSILKEYCVDENNINSGIALFKFLLDSGLMLSNSVLFKLIDYTTYKKYFLDQINSDLEVNNLNEFRNIFKKFNKVHIPKCYYYDKKKIIMSYEKGINLFKFIEKYRHNIQIIEETYLLLFSCIYKMIDCQKIHGDFHGGNLLFYLENEEVHISILDYGMIMDITKEQQNFFLDNFLDLDLYYKTDIKIQCANFFWHFGNHSQKYTKEKFLEIVTEKKFDNNVILPQEKFIHIPDGTIDIILNEKLVDIGFTISQEYYNIMITLDILMKKIANYAVINDKFTKKIKIYSIDNDFIE